MLFTTFGVLLTTTESITAMSPFSESQLEALKARLLPFGTEWTINTSRQLATLRDAIDFLAAMKNREDFWAQISTPANVVALSIDPAALRIALPLGTLASDSEAITYLRSLGLSDDELQTVVLGLDEPDFFDMAIRSAFAEGSPKGIARALEGILETNSDILATQCYVNRISESRGIARAVGAMMGIALLLLGASCSPQASPTAPTPSSSLQTPPVPAPTPDPTPFNVETPPVPAPTPSPTPSPTPAQPPRRKNTPTAPVPKYKGVSPKNRRSPK